ncbi:MAG: DUF4071 domain-containing protein [Cyanothece sp. SIO1E1]|nr:DUF4071 domain-containing protein [Cyanothece sp. SIO1E1]
MSQTSVGSPQSIALENAWQLYAQLQTNATALFNRYLRLRGWLITLSAIATFLALLTCTIGSSTEVVLLSEVLRTSLVFVSLSGTLVFVLINKLREGQYWLTLRAGAEEIRNGIYLYRTLLQGEVDRHQWLNAQVTEIQRQVLERVGGNLVLKSYSGQIPPKSATIAIDDPGDSDLLADEYLAYRLEPPLKWHAQELAKLDTLRNRLRTGVFIFAGLSALLPALSRELSLWVAFTVSVSIALAMWLEIRRLDTRIDTDNQLILELNIIRKYWQNLQFEERTGDAFFRLAIATEKVLWSQYSQPTGQMRQAVAALYDTSPDRVTQILSQSAPAAIDQALQHKYQTESLALSQVETDPSTTGLVIEAEAKIIEPEVTEPEVAEPEVTEPEVTEPEVTAEKVTIPVKGQLEKQPQRGLPHAFVVMPFGRKQGPDGRWIDFNSIYQDLIKPALEEAGFESFRADEEAASGDILTDMFQELLLADLVIADLSIDNANVFYELGIRHAMRRRGVVHIQSGRAYMPFDIISVRTIPYRCDDSGQPDPRYLEKDIQAIVKVVQATWQSDRNRIHSPIFNLLNGLIEPDRKTLRTPLATGYWQEYNELQERLTIAKRQKRIGDVLLLAEEVNNPLIKEDAIADAGKALKNMDNSALALKEYRQGLKINSENVEFRCEEAFHLSRLQQSDEAIVKLERLLEDKPTHIEAMSYLARIYKDMWKREWIHIADSQERIKAAYEASHLLQKAIESYLRGYQLNQNHYYSGINALTLTAILDHLAQMFDLEGGDLEEAAYRKQLQTLQGAVKFCLESSIRKDPKDPWAALSLGDLTVFTAEIPRQVTIAYKKALTLLWNNKFALQATLGQLELLQLLECRLDYVQAGVAVLRAELQRYESQEKIFAAQEEAEAAQQPAQVFLFSGHMVDAPGRPQPRFPAAMEHEARHKIESVLDKLQAHSNSIAITPGIACGGDIIFIEHCLKREMKLEVFLPFAPAEFIQNSVNFAGDNWVERFYTITNHPNVTIHLQPDRLGPVPEGENAYERNNRWALYSTLMYGIERTRLIVLWNGKGGDAPGGTGDMVQQVRQLGGIVEHIDTTKFDYWKTDDKVLEFAKAAVSH